MERGEFEPFPSVAEAKAYQYTLAEEATILSKRQQQIVGTQAQVAERLMEVAASVDADELSVISITPEFEQRVRCYELLAEVFGLAGFQG
jgi:alkanesulfonate monooxygenase SsuD/methylene tetrahydromethanopterin reductase-like flavin-dependent oxidoreductase (luciferase family)